MKKTIPILLVVLLVVVFAMFFLNKPQGQFSKFGHFPCEDIDQVEFTHHITNLEPVTEITLPIQQVRQGDLKAHMYFAVNDRVPVYAPTDAWLTDGAFYNEEDRKRGYIHGRDRQGKKAKISLVTISIGIVTTENRKIRHVAEVGEAGAELKQYAKSLKGSTFVKERRQEGT